MKTFEQTDICRQLKESNIPESAHLYVESLWLRNQEMETALRKIVHLNSNVMDDLEDVMNIATPYGV